MAVWLERIDELLRAEVLFGVATVVSGEGMGGKLLLLADGEHEGDAGLPGTTLGRVLEHAGELLGAHRSGSFEVAGNGDAVEIFFEAYPPPDKLIIVGAVHVAIPLVAIAGTLGFRTIVVDARSVYATEERFPHADELIVRWPATVLEEMRLHESTYCVFLTHDSKLDNPGLAVALRSPARYVGALGSRKTHAARVAALEEMGLTGEEIARIHAPIGIKLGGNRPEEIALSIAAQMVAARYGNA